MPLPTQSGGQSQGPSSSAPVSTEPSYPSSNKGKKREWTEQSTGNHHQISSLKVENSNTKSQLCEHSMNLEDTSTLIDMKDGLASLSRVEQLLSLMQQEKNDGTKKFTDVIRRWITVAGVVAATEQSDCLNHFIHLGGLKSLDEWLQEAHKGKVAESDKVIEEFTSALLNALENLPIDLEALQACSIGKSVKHLRNHKNSEIQRKARNLVDIWKKRVDVELKAGDETKGGTNHENMQVHAVESGLFLEGTNVNYTKAAGSSISGGNPGGGSDEGEPSGGKVQPNSVPANMDILLLEKAKDGAVSICPQENPGTTAVGVVNLNGEVLEQCILKPSCLESSSSQSCLDAEEASVHSVEDVTAIGKRSSPNVKEKDTKVEGGAESVATMDFDNDAGRGNSSVHAGDWTVNAHLPKVTERHISKESQLCLVASTGSALGQEIPVYSPLPNPKLPVKVLERPNLESPKGINGNLPISGQTDENDKRIEPCQKKGFRLIDSTSISTSIMSSLNSSSGDHQPCNTPLKMVDDDSSRYWKRLMEPKSEDMLTEDCEIRTSNSAEEASGTSYSAGNQEGAGTLFGDEGTFRKKFVTGVRVSDESSSRINMEENSAGFEEGNKTSKRWLNQKKSEEHVGKAAEIDLRFGDDDALEVARQVAKEVEQEVESYNEPLCSFSSEKDTKGVAVHSSTSASVGGEQEPFIAQVYSEEEIPVELIAADNYYSSMKKMDVKAESGNDEQSSEEKCTSEEINASTTEMKVSMQELDSCKVTRTSKESIPDDAQGKTIKSNGQVQMPKRCIFDLNEDIPTEEGEIPQEIIHTSVAATASASNYTSTNVSAPIPVVAASKGSLILPTPPLHFGGELGWRGSAATSAFRPAEPRQTPDRDRTQSTEENDSPPKPGRRFLAIDLNVTDDDDDAAMDLLSEGHGEERHVPASSSLPSGDSSMEVSSTRKAERLNLDLNRLGEVDDNGPALPSDWRGVERLGTVQKTNRSPSPTSSSRPATRDFDLNDHPSFDDSAAAAPAQEFQQQEYGMKSYNPSRLDDPLISMLGSRIDSDSINIPHTHPSSLAALREFPHNHVRKEFSNSAHSFLVSGPSAVSAMSNIGRMVPAPPALTYPTPSLSFPYNGLTLGSTFPLTSAVFASGAVPYMVDSVGAAIPPQILGPATISSSFSRPPYLMGVAGGGGINNPGILRPSLDLNAGLQSTEAEGRETGGNIRQLFFQGSQLSVEDQMRAFQQVASSGAPLKRKEPECGWESYQVGYKQATTWH